MFSKQQTIPLFQIDAFTNQSFKGNPAAVCILEEELDDDVLQKIAAEMNLSETAFVRVQDMSTINKESTFALRWFTPLVEVNLCGHATLATASVLFNKFGIESEEIFFETLSGRLSARKTDEGIALNFPRNSPQQLHASEELLGALGITNYTCAAYAEKVSDFLIEVDNEVEVKYLKPDFEKLKNLALDIDIRGIIITARGIKETDFVSRFFAPWVGINEDPVTGSAHTILAPYWSAKLHKNTMKAQQISARGGEITVRLLDDERVEIIGKTKMVVEGKLLL